MSVELVQFMSQLLNLVTFIQIFTRVKFAVNKLTVDSERTFSYWRKTPLSLGMESSCCTGDPGQNPAGGIPVLEP
jgi:hypothetical protein